MNSKPFAQGNFFIGCNYWASNAGMHMWHEWDEQCVEKDFARLAENKIDTLRIFPLWSDFQPLSMHYACNGVEREIRMGEKLLPFTEAGRAGVDETMVQRFQTFCDLAEKYHLKLIVGLLTGWMSGRLFVPPLLEGKNVLSDPMAMKWEIKFVRYMVKRFREHPAIIAWDLGNECNCMGQFSITEDMYVWCATISMAIRCEDPVRPIVSGMHGLNPNGPRQRMQDQGEFLDILTTHPYPLFTAHCNTDPMNRMKSALHAAAESTYYADIGGIPCFAEELGVLGPMMIADELACDYINACLFTLLAHNCRGLMWWCANEQIELTDSPYDWNSVERELGLFYADGSKKPVLGTLTRFAEFVEALPIASLPRPITDAVCILTRGQDAWAVAYGSFILAKKAGMTLRFAWADEEIPEASAYLLPSMTGDGALSRHLCCELLERAKQGAKLYLSIGAALLSPFSSFTGLRVLTRATRPVAHTAMLRGEAFAVTSPCDFVMESVGAEVLCADETGAPLFAKNAYGKGTVYTMIAPIENTTAVEPDMTDSATTPPLHWFYEEMNLRALARAASVDLPTVGITEHIADENTHILVLVNYEPFAQKATLTLQEGWHIDAVYSVHSNVTNKSNTLSFPHNEGAVVILKR